MKKTSKSQCNNCPALCCHGLTMDINKPRNRSDIDDLKWRLNYESVSAYILNNRWYLYVEDRCRYLGENDLCTIYDKRYDICRKHNPPVCERYMEWYDRFFKTPEELEEYFKKERARLKRRRAKLKKNRGA